MGSVSSPCTLLANARDAGLHWLWAAKSRHSEFRGTGYSVKLGILFGLAAVVGCAVFAGGEFGPGVDRDPWIVVGLGLITLSLLGFLAVVASHFPQLLLTVSATLGLACLAGVFVCLVAGHPKYAIVFGFWAATCAGGFLLMRREFGPRHMRRVRPAPGYCPRCGGRLGLEDNECPRCGLRP
jgi:hypothetical protein